jgi:hypothetical protein
MRVPVNKTNRTIKAILAKSAGEFWQRKGDPHVEEVDPSWTFETDFDPSGPTAFMVTPDGKSGFKVEQEKYRPRKELAPTAHLALVVARGIRAPQRNVTIYIPQLDHEQMDVARDALLVGDKQLIETALRPFGIYAGIARAILERQVRSFAKALHPKKSTRQIRREVDDFLRSQARA